MEVARRIVVNALCLVLAGALASLPATVRAAPPAPDAATQLARLGVSPAEAQARIAALDEAELAALATDLEEQPAGAGKEDVAIAFFITAGIVFVVLIITDATGVTDVFPWVKKPGARRR